MLTDLRAYAVPALVLAAIAGSTFQLLAATEAPTAPDRATELSGDYLISTTSGTSDARRVFDASPCDIGGHTFLKCYTYNNGGGNVGALQPLTCYINLDSIVAITELPTK